MQLDLRVCTTCHTNLYQHCDIRSGQDPSRHLQLQSWRFPWVISPHHRRWWLNFTWINFTLHPQHSWHSSLDNPPSPLTITSSKDLIVQSSKFAPSSSLDPSADERTQYLTNQLKYYSHYFTPQQHHLKRQHHEIGEGKEAGKVMLDEQDWKLERKLLEEWSSCLHWAEPQERK